MTNNKINHTTSIIKVTLLLTWIVLLTACYGPRINKKNIKTKSTTFPIITTASDQKIKVSLNKIFVRNLPGSWARDAKWDEYIFHIENLGNSAIEIDKIMVKGGLNEKHKPLTTRKKLNSATKTTIKDYKNAGFKIKLGEGSTKALLGSLTGTVISTGIGAGIASTGGLSIGAGTLTTAGGAVIIAVPVLAIGSIVKLVNNRKVSKQIKKRQTSLPLSVSSSDTSLVDLFYSAVPGPQSIEVWYSDTEGSHLLKLDLGDTFKALHYKKQR